MQMDGTDGGRVGGREEGGTQAACPAEGRPTALSTLKFVTNSTENKPRIQVAPLGPGLGVCQRVVIGEELRVQRSPTPWA